VIGITNSADGPRWQSEAQNFRWVIPTSNGSRDSVNTYSNWRWPPAFSLAPWGPRDQETRCCTFGCIRKNRICDWRGGRAQDREVRGCARSGPRILARGFAAGGEVNEARLLGKRALKSAATGDGLGTRMFPARAAEMVVPGARCGIGIDGERCARKL